MLQVFDFFIYFQCVHAWSVCVCTMRAVKWAGTGDWFDRCRALVTSVRTGIVPKSSCGLWTWTIGPCPIHDKTTSWIRTEQRRIREQNLQSNLEKNISPVFRQKTHNYTHMHTVFNPEQHRYSHSEAHTHKHRLPLTKGGWTLPNTAMRRVWCSLPMALASTITGSSSELWGRITPLGTELPKISNGLSSCSWRRWHRQKWKSVVHVQSISYTHRFTSKR